MEKDKNLMRLFYGIPIQDNDILKKLRKELKKCVDGKFVEPHNYHITLKFIGEVEIPNQYIRNLEKIEFRKFNLKFKKLGAFPSMENPRVIWLGCEGEFFWFKNILEINFVPHLTLVRVKKITDKNYLKDLFNKSFEFSQEVEEAILYKSTLTPNGPIYEKIFVKKYSFQ